jgi:hypothetical protein
VPEEVASGMFRAVGSIPGPLALTVLVAAVTSAGGWATYGPVPPLAALPLALLYMLPILTYVWVYLVILFELDRLGRRPLAVEGFPHDRSLGLATLGSLASTGLGILLVAAAPVLIAGSDEPVTLGISLTILAISLGSFVLSIWRLHRQMVVAKTRYVAVARRLYAEVAPRSVPTRPPGARGAGDGARRGSAPTSGPEASRRGRSTRARCASSRW